MVRIEAVEPERWCDADWRRCYALHCSAHGEQGSAARSLAAYRLAHLRVPGAVAKHCWVARDESAIVGKLDLVIADVCVEEASLALYVAPAARGRGIAHALLRAMLPIAERHAARMLHAGAVQPAGWSLCEGLGGQLEHTTVQQTLDLEAVNWPLVRAWCENTQQARSTRLEWFETLPVQLVNPFLDLQQRAWADFPSVLTQASAGPTLAQRREDERRHQLLGWRWLTVAARERDGIVTGATDVTYDPLQPDLVRQNLTVVSPNHRGSGLARRLKSAMLFRVREQFPKAQRLVTANSADNTAMLEINRKLGFVRVSQQRVYGLPLAQLRDWLSAPSSAS